MTAAVSGHVAVEMAANSAVTGADTDPVAPPTVSALELRGVRFDPPLLNASGAFDIMFPKASHRAPQIGRAHV